MQITKKQNRELQYANQGPGKPERSIFIFYPYKEQLIPNRQYLNYVLKLLLISFYFSDFNKALITSNGLLVKLVAVPPLGGWRGVCH